MNLPIHEFLFIKLIFDLIMKLKICENNFLFHGLYWSAIQK